MRCVIACCNSMPDPGRWWLLNVTGGSRRYVRWSPLPPSDIPLQIEEVAQPRGRSITSWGQPKPGRLSLVCRDALSRGQEHLHGSVPSIFS